MNELEIAYAEVLTIINQMDTKFKEKIPAKLLKYMEKHSPANYEFKLDSSKPFNENKFGSKTLPLLAMINLNYWCETKEEKEAQKEIHKANDEKPEQKEKNIIKKEEVVNAIDESGTQPFLWLELPEDTWFEKLIYKIKYFFKKRKWKSK